MVGQLDSYVVEGGSHDLALERKSGANIDPQIVCDLFHAMSLGQHKSLEKAVEHYGLRVTPQHLLKESCL